MEDIKKMENLEKVNKDLVKYIEENVLPVYANNDKGHQEDHIRYVIRRSLKFAEQFENINLDMCYAIAAYHDIGHYINKDEHHIVSAQKFLEDEKMKEFFTDDERIIIKEAIEDHRASSKEEPRSDYGKIVSSADRSTNLDHSLFRVYEYGHKHYPEQSEVWQIARAISHINKKYGKNGYSTTYVKDDEYEAFVKESLYLISHPREFIVRYLNAGNPSLEIKKDDKVKELFLGDEKRYIELLKLAEKKRVLKELRSVTKLDKPYIVEFTGTPRTGKTTTIENLVEFFKKGGFDISVVEEFTTSEEFKEFKEKYRNKMTLGEWNLAIADVALSKTIEASKGKEDIVLIDRGINDRQIWNHRRYMSGDIDEEKYNHITEMLTKSSEKLEDMLVETYATPTESVKRDYKKSIALEPRNFLTEQNVKEYNESMEATIATLMAGAPHFLLIDTMEQDTQKTTMQVAGKILDDMTEKYLDKIEKKLAKVKEKDIDEK